jgi:hypothetical protein
LPDTPLANPLCYEYNLFGKNCSLWSDVVPVSKKRKKKKSKPMGPPPSKSQLAAKKRKLTKQQILIYVFSALIIISLAASFIVSSGSSAPPPTDDQGVAPIVGDENVPQPEVEQESDVAPENDTSEADTGN